MDRGKSMDKEDMNKEAPITHRIAIRSVPHKLWLLLGDYATDNAFTSRSAAALFILNRFFLKETSDENSSEGDM